MYASYNPRGAPVALPANLPPRHVIHTRRIYTPTSLHTPHEGAPVVLPAMTVAFSNSAFSLLAGVTVFAFLGYLSEQVHIRCMPVYQCGQPRCIECEANLGGLSEQVNIRCMSVYQCLPPRCI